jgi:hypothetical protein
MPAGVANGSARFREVRGMAPSRLLDAFVDSVERQVHVATIEPDRVFRQIGPQKTGRAAGGEASRAHRASTTIRRSKPLRRLWSVTRIHFLSFTARFISGGFAF